MKGIDYTVLGICASLVLGSFLAAFGAPVPLDIMIAPSVALLLLKTHFR